MYSDIEATTDQNICCEVVYKGIKSGPICDLNNFVNNIVNL